MITILTFSLATGLMALTPERGWIFLTLMRFIVGFGVGGFFAVDMPLLQEFVPASRRGWISGASTSLLPAGPLAAGALSAALGPIIGWRGLFCDRVVAGADGLRYSRLGPGIAALAHRQGAARGGAPLARLGADA